VSIRSGIAKGLVILFLCVAIFGGAGYFSYKLFITPKKMVEKAMAGPQPTMPPDPSIAEYEKCLKVKENGNLVEARNAFEDFTTHNPDSPKIDDAMDALGDINMKLFFSDAPDPEKQQYVIQKGDTISAIERKTKVPSDLIMRLNKIEDPTKLRIGEILNISRPQFSLKINHKTKTVMLYNKGKFFKQYKVEPWNVPPPKGSAPSSAKVVEKSAWKDNQRVAFGAKEYNESGRWIATSATGYTLYSEGVDGVPKPQGGLGMKDQDIQELSTLINRGTPVTIE
jgi:hypothetical protein